MLHQITDAVWSNFIEQVTDRKVPVKRLQKCLLTRTSCLLIYPSWIGNLYYFVAQTLQCTGPIRTRLCCRVALQRIRSNFLPPPPRHCHCATSLRSSSTGY